MNLASGAIMSLSRLATIHRLKGAINIPGSAPTGGELPKWVLELAEQIKLIPPGLELPTGVIVGSAVIRARVAD